MPFRAVQQNLNQIAQICNQLSQNEQANVSRLTQMQQLERTASQQLQQCAQLCNQVNQQMQQLAGSQMAGIGQYSTTGVGIGQYSSTGAGVGQFSPGGAGAGQFSAGGAGFGTSSWANRPINTNNAFAGAGQFGFEAAKEFGPTGQSGQSGQAGQGGEAGATGQAAFNTNKDLNR
ncbi:MAG: hypothetical protein ACYC21_10270 [Eubacteriales bacterium]